MKNNIVFISHSNPEDNYFAAWLAAKLKTLGYNSWVDLKNLSAGDSFNTVIKPIIKEKSVLFIAITSENYIAKSNNQNTGVSRELNCATTVDTKKFDHNFLIPIKIDNSNYNDFPYHYLGWNSIDFSNNWKEGLISLCKQLKDFKIPENHEKSNPLQLWYEVINSQNIVKEKRERYFSNWFKIFLPKKVFIHIATLYDEDLIYKIPYPVILESKSIISFTTQETIGETINLSNTFIFDSIDFIDKEEIKVTNDFILKEPSKKLIRLLNVAFQSLLYSKDLIAFKRGVKVKRKIFYFRHISGNRKSINISRYGNSKHRRWLTGRSSQVLEGVKKIVNWHFALNAEASIDHTPHYRVYYSVIFTDENFMRYDKVYQHKFRRSIPNDWFNRKWFEILLAAIIQLSPNSQSKYMTIKIDKKKVMKISNEPFNAISHYGYVEPNNV